KLHTRYIYEADREEQEKVKQKIESLLESYDDDRFRSLAFNNDTRHLIDELIACKNDRHWHKVVRKFLKGMDHLLAREIRRARKLRRPGNVVAKVKKELKRAHIYHRKDIIRVEEKKPGIIQVDYISMQHSPEYDRKFKTWRDTQFKFTLNFNKNLFIWLYINVHPSLRGKGMGTRLVMFCEKLAKDLGFRRFTVEWPNRKFWMKRGYDIPLTYRIGRTGKMNYTHEGYKEF
ncbi:GNAT family N-acetyltransferase, partial [Candidatus Woesearchaeota archaeon]|nr:GNAT family N-acetyltransferase [Candidatus Woesearchaeota archaeon]